MFEDEIEGVQIMIESQSGDHPIDDIKMSFAQSFRAPGCHIYDAVAQVLKKQ
jgi:hypothetical protein